jgi:hypothetical protein
VKLDARLICQVQILNTQLGDLLDTRAGVIKEQEESTIPKSITATRGKAPEQVGNFITLQVVSLRRNRPLHRDARDLLA